MLDKLIAQYEARMPAIEALRDEIGVRLSPLGADPLVNLHSVSHRVKTPRSLRGKLARPDRTYRRLTDVTDLVGFRVVTYFDDGVEAAARFVEREFDVDLTNSADKRGRDALDRFGYRSLHYVCRPPAPVPLPDLRFEVQIRTILQHAWAEIEHDLGYKNTDAIPAAIRRRFSRLAGLLELADDEFLAIKRDLQQHKRDVIERVRTGSAGVALDTASLGALLEDPQVGALDNEIAAQLQQPRSQEAFYPDYLVRMFHLLGIDHVDQLRTALHRHAAGVSAALPPYFAFAGPAFGLTQAKVGPVKRGYGLLFLAHLLLAGTEELEVALVDRATGFFYALDYPDDPDEARRVAILFVRTVRGADGAAFRVPS